ncbi:MAG: class I SAM-dependent methyltransferase, partial [Phycisphaerales bacterium]
MNTQIPLRFSKRSFDLVAIAILFIVLSAIPAQAKNAADLLEMAGTKGGLIVHLGCRDGELTAALRTGDQYFVHGLDTDVDKVAAARKRIMDRGFYGPVSADKWDGRHLPYVDNLVNLVVAEESELISKLELFRVLAPRGVALIREQGKWSKIVKLR